MKFRRAGCARRQALTAIWLVVATVAPIFVPRPAAAAPSKNSADRIIFWAGYCTDLAEMSDADLQAWRAKGVGGFECGVRQLAAWGGGARFTADPNLAALDDPNDPSYGRYGIQRTLRDTRFAERVKANGMKLYLGVYTASDLPGARTPFVDWFDDAVWAEDVIPQLGELAGALQQLGFAGVAFDHENYPAHDNPDGVYWSSTYAGNTHSPEETRAKIKQRGREVGKAIVSAYPGVEYVAYRISAPAGWDAYHQYKRVGINQAPACDAGGPAVDFWEGIASATGYDAIRFWEAVFYKPANSGTNYETANQYNTGEMYAFFSRCWDKWKYASSRLHVSPFTWLDGSPSADASDRYNSPYPPEEADDALRAFSKWGTGREFAVFSAALSSFDYSPYLAALRDAARPKAVDTEPPTLTLTLAPDGSVGTRSGSRLELTGSANDNLAIRSVTWKNDRGGSGTAPMTWTVVSGDESTSFVWQMDWTARDIPIKSGRNCISITATDIKGLSTTRTLAVGGGGGCLSTSSPSGGL